MNSESWLENTPDGVCVSNGEGKLLYLNAAAKRLLHLEGKNWRNLNLCETLCGNLYASGPESCGKRCTLRELHSPEREVTFQGTFRNNQGNQSLRVHCMRTLDKVTDSWTVERHLTIIEDASSRMQMQRERDEWVQMMALEIKTVLSSCSASMGIMRDNFRENLISPEEVHLMEITLNSSERMMQALDLFLQLAHLDPDAIPLNNEEVEIETLLKECIEEEEKFANSKEIRISLEAERGIFVLGDYELLRRVFRQLLNNSIKFSPENSRIIIRSASGDSNDASISFEDKGIGISSEYLPGIFDRFHFETRGTRSFMDSGGIGLAFCKQAVKAMKGGITVKSHPGLGSEFTVRLPAASQK